MNIAVPTLLGRGLKVKGGGVYLVARNTDPYWYDPLTSHPGLLSLNSNLVILHPHPPFLILWDVFQDENPQKSGVTSPQYLSPLYASWPWLT